ncbi:PKS16 protein [Bisporella sp. PMI_857]|nr:PKS16 protein [Bisporella sp. PMI_857]
MFNSQFPPAMLTSTQVLLFGDQTENIAPTIKRLYRHSKRSPYLRAFLQGSTDAVHRAVSELPSSEQSRFRFSSFLDLTEIPNLDVDLQTLLFCIAQLGCLIAHVEADPRLLERRPSKSLVVLGFCTGLLAAAATAAHSMVEIIELAPEIVAVSVRLGQEVRRRSSLLEDSKRSWARAITGYTAAQGDEKLIEFLKVHAVPSHRKPYISAVSATSITFSGPPSILDLFFSEMFPQLPTFSLPISAAFHAPHLCPPDIDSIINASGAGSIFQKYTLEDVEFLSPTSGLRYTSQNLSELLSHMISDIFQNCIDSVQVFKEMTAEFGSRHSELCLVPIGPNSMLKHLTKSLDESKSSVTATIWGDDSQDFAPSSAMGDVAIVGMAGRFPGAETLEEFWDVLQKGLDLHREIPSDRFDIGTAYDPTGKHPNTTSSPYGCFIERPGVFDARLFNMSPREAAQTDPGQRLLLMTTYEALEMSGYSQEHDLEDRDTKVGSFFGQTIDDWREYNAADNVDMYFVTGGIRAFSAGRVNYHFKWEGPSFSVDSACSSSLIAVQLACSSLLARECNMAVAGGSNILTGCNMYSGLSKGNFLSRTGSCKTFDSSADGYCRGDGVGVIVLKRLDDAIASRDNILAVVKGAATNHSAQAISITHPHVGTQEKLFKEVLQQAAVDPSEIDYVEMHGTGTQAGDAAECESVMNVLAKQRRRHPLSIGSLKPNVGHGEAAAGVTSLIKVLMMLQKDKIAPHIGIKDRINPNLPSFTERNVQIATSGAFKGQAQKRKILLNNFSAAGGNTSLVIEDGPGSSVVTADPRTSHVVCVSAKTSWSLKENISRLLTFLESTDCNLADIAYTTTARRMHHPIRLSYSVRNTEELRKTLDNELSMWKDAKPINNVPQIVFIFPGQGAVISGVTSELYKSSLPFRRDIDNYESICKQQGLPSFLDTLTGQNQTPSPSESQLCLVAIELALANLWRSWGLRPSLVIGHSLGEYAALCVAGVISTADTFFLVAKRAALMMQKCTPNTHQMLSLQLSADQVQSQLSVAQLSSLEVACINGPNSTVVSGSAAEIAIFQKRLESAGVTTKLLAVPYSFHSKQMDSILEEYEAIASNVHFSKPNIPVASTLLGEVIRDDDVFSANYLASQARRSVNYTAALQACVAEGLVSDNTLWLESGPGATCTSFVRSTLNIPLENTITTLRPTDDYWVTVTKGISNAYRKGVHVKWSDFHSDHKQHVSLVALPSYAFDLKNFWIEYRAKKETSLEIKASLPLPPSICLQHVVESNFEPSKAAVAFTSDFGSPQLSEMARGHLVNGLGLCPSSVYAEMAFAAATYIFQRGDSSVSIPPMDLSDMDIFSPFIVNSDGINQILRVEAVQEDSGPVRIQFSSQSDSSLKEHARCSVLFGQGKSLLTSWNRNGHLIRERIQTLKEQVKTGNVHDIRQKLVYKLFQCVVDYSGNYQALDEVYMHSDIPEAASRLKFQTSATDGHFVHSPYWIDCLAQLGGFCLNVNPPVAEDVVYLSHGWKSMRITGPLSDKQQYFSYVRMQPEEEPGLYTGDVYVMDASEVVAICSGLKFKQMKRSLLETLLGTRSHKAQITAPIRQPERRQHQQPQRALPAQSMDFSDIIGVISSEVGLNSSEFAEEVRWTDLGIDSILTISILQKIRGSTSMDLPSSLFVSCPTVRELETYFRDRFESDQSSTMSSPCPSALAHRSTISSVSSLDSTLPDAICTPPDHVLSSVTSLIITELGIDGSEVEASTRFADVGLDSLLTISILGALREELSISLPSSFFTSNPTFGDIKGYFGQSFPKLESVSASLAELSGYKSTPVLLQGNPTPNSPALFILPDGSGSALSYIDLPVLSKSLPVYALNSPFLNRASEYTLSFETVAKIFIKAIQDVQPHGPYLICGWSMGGIFAYEVARQLLEAGQEIPLLLFMDSPCPRTLPPLPAPTLDILEKAGLFDGMDKSGKGISEETRQHFLASVRTLEHFDPKPIRSTFRLGHVAAIWAKDGMLEGVSEEKRIALSDSDDQIAGEAKNWLFGERKDYGPAGWDKLAGKKVECHIVAGNHFSIMKAPQVNTLGTILAQSLRKVGIF